MARGDHWWNEPPWWAWATIAVSLVAIIVMLPFALNREPPEPDGSTATARTSEPGRSPASASGPQRSASETSAANEDAARVLVVGDVDTGGFAPDSAGWPTVLEERLPGVDMTVATTGDAGYVTTEAGTEATIPELVDAADLTGVDVVVIFGSRFDAAGIADQVNLAAGTAIGAVAERAPDAELVVIGPAWPGPAAPAGVRNNRDVVRSAAETVGAVFVDPLTEGWLTDAPGLVNPDGEHLSAAADIYFAARIEPLLRQALAA